MFCVQGRGSGGWLRKSVDSCVLDMMRLSSFKSLIPASAGQCVSMEPKETVLNYYWMVTVLPMWLHCHLNDQVFTCIFIQFRLG